MNEYRADTEGARFNVNSIASKVDRNGYLKVKGTFTRAGIFNYPQPDGSVRRELRHPEDVLRADSINTLKLIPVAPVHDHKLTNANLQHPSDAARFKSIGVTGENISVTSDAALDGALAIHDQDTILELMAADAKKEELPQISAAYSFPAIDETPGYFDGSKWGIESGDYDARQMPPYSYGHVTLVERGRAGSRCQIRADQAQKSKEEKQKMLEKVRTLPVLKLGSGDNVFRADSVDVTETPETLKLIRQREDLYGYAKKEAVRADTAEGSLSVAQKDLKDLQEKSAGMITEEQYRADMKESLALSLKIKQLGLKEAPADVTPKGLQMEIIKAMSPDDETRADTDDGYRAGVMAGIERDWDQKISRHAMQSGIEEGLQNVGDPAAGGENFYNSIPKV